MARSNPPEMKRTLVLLIAVAFSVSACANASTGGTSAGTSGIQGKVLLGPMCPVLQSGSPCPDRPIEADITVTALDGKVVATGHSDTDGSYRISLGPGSYTVTAKRPGGAFGASKPATVEVTADSYVRLDVLVDSGIR
jgi:Carboxypeptidase regulatory-like domain